MTFTGITVIFLCFIEETFTQALLHIKQQETTNLMLNGNLIILQELCMYTLNPLFNVCTTSHS